MIPVERGVVDAVCFHCGLPVDEGASWRVVIDGVERAMCCPGCEAVAQSIVDNGFSNYYATRSGFAATVSAQDLAPPELRLYDSEQAEAGMDADIGEAVYSVRNIRCAACIFLIESRLARLPGIVSAEVNAVTERLLVRWRVGACKPSDILAAMRAIGYAAYPYDPVQHGEQLERERKTLFRQLFIAGLSMMQVMMYAVPIYLAGEGGMDADMAGLMRWAGLLLTVPALAYSAQPFFFGAWRDIRNRAPGMDVPVALGIAAAFAGSALATWRGEGAVYFDSVTMFIFLLLCSRYLELTARRKAASALDNLQQSLPASALLMADYPQRTTELVAATQLREGDVILVRPGDALPADCTVIEGESSVDLSLLTGESRPQNRIVGDAIPGGAVNVAQALLAKVTRSVGDSTLSVLVRLVNRAGQAKPQLALWADRVAAWFVACLLLLSVAVFFAWQMVDPARAWPVAIAVLVVSCPCALSLATPTALAAATDRLLRQGILVVQPHVLETLHRATHIVFDKTGTLTTGKPALQEIVPLGALSATDCLRIAAAMECSSMHPLAQTILKAAEGLAAAEATALRHAPGQGLEAIVDGVLCRLGNFAFVHALIPTASTMPAADAETEAEASYVFLASTNGWLARFDIADAIRPEAQAVVSHFHKQGKSIVLLSGDRHEVTQRVADRLGIPTALGDCLPESKLSFVQRLQQGGAVVAMVGDGINDAAVLRAADVSFAMGNGAALAQTHADCVLLSGTLSSLCEADKVAARALSIIRQNLAWATLYNVVAIPAAALGWLNPWLSGIGMSLSSVVVVLNALRLRRSRNTQNTRNIHRQG
ncbi:heavy metal translocating P-type ATPase [Herbaspirillum sp. RV1423]|uniref:heavy metal translocating P-type ATPase n=1 Tax=Herbaspirillum sp. RV1423 TaxID=1443993 RepID=UPI0004B16C2C|nr:heavy metal translocating P-type ATPase [Herbaspirillum sp. RV1423]